jgi:hypothetical protein
MMLHKAADLERAIVALAEMVDEWPPVRNCDCAQCAKARAARALLEEVGR